MFYWEFLYCIFGGFCSSNLVFDYNPIANVLLGIFVLHIWWFLFKSKSTIFVQTSSVTICLRVER